MLAASKKEQLYLELFSGSERLAHELRKAGEACVAVDNKTGAHHDLCSKKVRDYLKGCIKAGLVKGVWIAFPCASWSNARRPMIRDKQNLWGLPSAMLHAGNPARVKQGNRTLRVALELARACLRHGVPCVMENPQSSLAWSTLGIVNLAKAPEVSYHIVDFCQYNVPWRKRTMLLAIWCPHAPDLLRRCSGRRGQSDLRPLHARLQGRDPHSQQLWTQVAEPYPKPLAKVFTLWLLRASDVLQLSHLTALAG